MGLTMTTMQDSKLLTTQGYAALHGRHHATIRNWCKRGQVDGAYRTTGGHWRIPVSAPLDFQLDAVDCREGILKLADASVSLVLTDPPYGLDGMDGDWNLGRLNSRVKAGVVGSLPAGMKFDPAQGRKLQAFLQPIVAEWMRVLKPGAFALCFAQPRLAHRVAAAMEDAGFEIRDMLAWQHEGQQPKAFSQDHFVKRMDIPESEKRRIVAELGGRKTPQLRPEMEMIVLGQRPRDGTFVANWLEHQVGLIDVGSPLIEPTRFPSQVIRHPKADRIFDHMTVKPVEVLRHLVRIFSKRAGVVLDTFAGTGSTGVACAHEGRQFIGFERDTKIAEAALERIRSEYHAAQR